MSSINSGVIVTKGVAYIRKHLPHPSMSMLGVLTRSALQPLGCRSLIGSASSPASYRLSWLATEGRRNLSTNRTRTEKIDDAFSQIAQTLPRPRDAVEKTPAQIWQENSVRVRRQTQDYPPNDAYSGTWTNTSVCRTRSKPFTCF